jgi:hypothetical protein
MTEQSNGSLSPRTKWLLVAVAIAALLGVFASMATSLAIRDLKESQQQVIDQLKALQEGVSSNRAELKRLFEHLVDADEKVGGMLKPEDLSGPAMSKVGGAPIPTALPSCFHHPGFGLAAVDAIPHAGEAASLAAPSDQSRQDFRIVIQSAAGWGIAMRRFILLGILCALSIAGGPARCEDRPPPWAYPVNPPDFKPPPDDSKPRQVPDSSASYTVPQTRDRF